MKNLQKVEGHEGLLKDPVSGSIINIDNKSLSAAKAAKNRILSEMKKTESLQERVDKLESLMQKLLEDR